jgi:hypothetical protein
MVENQKKQIMFRLSLETIKTLDSIKNSLGFASRSDAIRFIIHKNNINLPEKSYSLNQVNTILLSLTIILLTGNMLLR